MKTGSAVFIGRFQPLHRGHLYALKCVFRKHGKFLVIVGSAQKSGARNPFSVQVRRRMLRAVLRENKMCAGVRILKDYRSNAAWVREFGKLAGDAKTIYSNNSLVKKLCREAGYKVVPIPFYKRYKYYATLIRRRMRRGKSWRQLVPKEVLKIISS